MFAFKMIGDKLESTFGRYWWVLAVFFFFGLYLGIIFLQVFLSTYTAVNVSAAAPSNPQGMILTAGDTEVSLSWSLPADDGAQSNWYNSNWLYRKPISISSAMVSGTADLSNFPVLVNITEADLIGAAQSDADDILFTASDGTTKLDHEIEYFNPATGELQAWILIPTLSYTTDTDLFMYYDNPSALNQENVAALWTNYEFVYHFGEGSGTVLSDSTGNLDATLTSALGWSSGDVIGNSYNFQELYSAVSTNTFTGTKSGTITAWVRIDDNTRSGHIFALDRRWGVRYDPDPFNQIDFEIQGWEGDGLPRQSTDNTLTWNNGQWYHLADRFDQPNTSFDLFVDNVPNTTTTASVMNSLDYTNNLYIGDYTDLADSFPGYLDEVRLATGLLSDDWLATEYENQANNSAHVSSGTQEQYESGVITDYVIEYRVVGAPSYTTFPDGVSAATATLVTGLANGTDYEFRVSAVNSTGNGTPTAAQQATPAGVPLATSDLAAVAGGTEVDLSWSAPADNGSAITDYIVEYKLTSAGSYTTFSDGVGTITSTTVTGLVNGNSYDFRIAAVNSQGQGAYSNVDTATPVDVPVAVSDLSAAGEDSQVSINWTAPIDNGSAIIDYIIEYKLTSAGSYSTFTDGTSTATSSTVTGLTNGQSYDFRVAAVNGVGQSAYSNIDSATPNPAATVPGAPTSVSATAGDEEVSITWSAPVSDGGDAITDYQIQYKESTAGPYNIFSDGVSTSTNATVTGLTAGTDYDFRIAAINGVGTGASSSSDSATPFRYLVSGDITGLTIACVAAQTNSTTACDFSLVEYILLPANFAMSIGSGSTTTSCSRVTTLVQCSNVPTGSSAGSIPIYGWLGMTQTDSGETASISAPATSTSSSSSVTASTTSSNTTSSNSSSSSSSSSSSTSTTTSDIPVQDEQPTRPLDEGNIDEATVICDESQQSGTTQCSITLPGDVDGSEQEISISIGENGPITACQYQDSKNSFLCVNVPVGEIIGSIPVYIKVGTADLIRTAAKIIVNSVLSAIDYRDLEITVVTPSGEPAVNLLEEFVIQIRITNNTDEIQSRLKLIQSLPDQITVVEDSFSSINQVLLVDDLRVAEDNTLSTGEFNLAPGQVAGFEYRARVVNDDILQVEIYAQLQSSLGQIRSESIDLLITRSNSILWWLFIIFLLFILALVAIAAYVFITSRRGQSRK